MLHMADGSVQELDLAEHVANMRFEILKPQHLSPRICVLFDDIATIEYRDESTTESYSCRK